MCGGSSGDGDRGNCANVARHDAGEDGSGDDIDDGCVRNTDGDRDGDGDDDGYDGDDDGDIDDGNDTDGNGCGDDGRDEDNGVGDGVGVDDPGDITTTMLHYHHHQHGVGDDADACNEKRSFVIDCDHPCDSEDGNCEVGNVSGGDYDVNAMNNCDDEHVAMRTQ